jgi:hypothetical protein
MRWPSPSRLAPLVSNQDFKLPAPIGYKCATAVRELIIQKKKIYLYKNRDLNKTILIMILVAKYAYTLLVALFQHINKEIRMNL